MKKFLNLLIGSAVGLTLFVGCSEDNKNGTTQAPSANPQLAMANQNPLGVESTQLAVTSYDVSLELTVLNEISDEATPDSGENEESATETEESDNQSAERTVKFDLTHLPFPQSNVLLDKDASGIVKIQIMTPQGIQNSYVLAPQPPQFQAFQMPQLTQLPAESFDTRTDEINNIQYLVSQRLWDSFRARERIVFQMDPKSLASVMIGDKKATEVSATKQNMWSVEIKQTEQAVARVLNDSSEREVLAALNDAGMTGNLTAKRSELMGFLNSPTLSPILARSETPIEISKVVEAKVLYTLKAAQIQMPPQVMPQTVAPATSPGQNQGQGHGQHPTVPVPSTGRGQRQ